MRWRTRVAVTFFVLQIGRRMASTSSVAISATGFVPTVGLALNGVPPAELRYASGLFNLTRNLGGAIGIAAVTTWLQDFGRIHGERFGEALSDANTSGLAHAAARISALTPDHLHAQMILQGELAQRKEASWHTGALLFRKGDPAEGVYGLCGTQACAIGEVYASRVQHRLSCPALWSIGNDPRGGTWLVSGPSRSLRREMHHEVNVVSVLLSYEKRYLVRRGEERRKK